MSSENDLCHGAPDGKFAVAMLKCQNQSGGCSAEGRCVHGGCFSGQEDRDWQAEVMGRAQAARIALRIKQAAGEASAGVKCTVDAELLLAAANEIEGTLHAFGSIVEDLKEARQQGKDLHHLLDDCHEQIRQLACQVREGVSC